MSLTPKQIRWAKRFKIISILEGLSFLILLFIAMPLKYIFELPTMVTWTGWVHGALFIIYVYTVFPTAHALKWNFRRTFFALIASILPFGPFIFDRNLQRSQHVEL